MLRLVVLISGNGSNLQAIIDFLQQHPDMAQIAAVISDQPQAYGLQRAEQAKIPTAVITKAEYPIRELYDQQLQKTIDGYEVNLVVLAGFMRILTSDFVKHYRGKLINIHPSLLPKHKGMNTHQRVLDAGDTEHGASVHYVTEELDGGPIIAQSELTIAPQETPETLRQRVHQLEHILYPQVIQWFAEKRLDLCDNQVYFNQQPLPASGVNVLSRTKATYFISDIHLDLAYPEVVDTFIDFLTHQARHADAVYLLGDIFEIWLGDDDDTPLYQRVADALRQLAAQGVKVYAMRGNRDFLFGPRFSKRTGATLLKDPTVIDLYGTKTLVMHGDLLCTDDVKYQAFRRKINNPVLQWLYEKLPLSWRQKITDYVRGKSKQYTRITAMEIQDVNPHAVADYCRKYQVTQLIHGHTHRPAEHLHLVDGKTVIRRVLNAWHDHGGGLKATADGKVAPFRLTFREPK